jgi:uncharacterized protein YcbK (DUF882 family)
MNQPTIYFTIDEMNAHKVDITPEIDENIHELISRLSQVREALGKPMVVTSGLRSIADQMMINPSASKSKHLYGQAVDISDPDGSLAKWVQDNMSLMEHIGFWFEDFGHTHGWVHFQTVPPASGHRVFIP